MNDRHPGHVRMDVDATTWRPDICGAGFCEDAPGHKCGGYCGCCGIHLDEHGARCNEYAPDGQEAGPSLVELDAYGGSREDERKRVSSDYYGAIAGEIADEGAATSQGARKSDTTPPPRQNSQGHPCPPWCVTDHDERVGRSRFTLTFHGSDTPMIWAPSGYVHATAYQDGFGGAAPQIALTSRAAGGAVLVDVGDAGKLADFIGQLADATPEQHRELAAAIRQAAAVIAEGLADTETTAARDV